MRNKIILFFLIGCFSFSLTAQSYRANRRNRNRRGTQNVSVEQTKTKETNKKKTDPSAAMTAAGQYTSNKNSVKFDPKKPVLTQSQIDYMLNELIRKKLLEYKISAKLILNSDDNEDTPEDGGEKANFALVSQQNFSILMSRYKSLIGNFELTEVSRIRPEWYQRFQTELNKFGPIINEMMAALWTRNRGRYAAAAQKFKTHQEACLKFLKEKPPRISKEQYEALVLKNSKIRQQNYLKKLREEREAAMKRRQEQLKQLQQKNQPKNQQNQKPTLGAGK